MRQIFVFLMFLFPVWGEAQVVERFEGEEIGLEWTGADREQFVVNGAGQLQVRGEPKEKGKASIAREIFYASTMQWEFDVAMKYAPSSDNRLCVYLLLGETQQSYHYIRIGFKGERDLCLRKQGDVVLISPVSAFTGFPLFLHVKVTLENGADWKLYYKTDEMEGYRLEGSCHSPVELPVGKNFFMVQMVYTKSRRDLFRIDNICISDQLSETPLEQDDEELDDEKWDEEDWDEEDQQDPTSPEIPEEPNEEEEPDVEEEPAPDPPAIPGLDEGPAAYAAGSVRISEVMADPKGLVALPETEYVELYNASEEVISLAGWTLVYRDKVKVPLAAEQLQPGGYALLYREGRTVKAAGGTLEMPLPKFPAALANTGNALRLEDPSGTVIDDILYEKAKQGIAWERDEAGGWYLSTDERGGTPGAANSPVAKEPEEEPEEPLGPKEPDEPEQPAEPSEPGEEPEEPSQPTPSEPEEDGSSIWPGDLLFNELLPNPFVDGSEYIELYNASERRLSVRGLILSTRKSDGSLSTRYSLASVGEVEAGGYLLLSKKLEGVEPFYLIRTPEALHELKLPILANTASTLVLYRAGDGTVIDEVSYSAKWHAPSVKNEKGVALERIRTDRPTQESSNWASATEESGFGTPGYRNSQIYREEEPGEEPAGIEPPVYSPETGEYAIAYYLNEAGYNCRAYLFDTMGRRVAEIANHELLGSFGTLRWDGRTSDGDRLPAGIYILYVELYHPEGAARRFKKAFLVR